MSKSIDYKTTKGHNERKVTMKIDSLIIIAMIICIFLYAYLFKYDSVQQFRFIQSQANDHTIVDINQFFHGNKIMWAHLRGDSPRFIEDQPFRGLGWAEFPMYQIKSMLTSQFDLEIVSWYITSARLEKEFSDNTRPVCFYPYIWRNPKKEFDNKVDFLYSVGMGLGRRGKAVDLYSQG